MFSGTKTVIFDAFGTLFDVHSPARELAPQLGENFEAFSTLWRQKQLEYSWLRSLMRRHADFGQVTEEALDYALAAFGHAENKWARTALLELYQRLKAYPDAVLTLDSLSRKNLRTGILSNGSPQMLHAAVVSAGLGELLDAVLSVEEVQVFKPDPRVYALALDRFGIRDPEQVVFVTANPWDAHGAASFGFRVIRVNRAGLPDENLPGAVSAYVKSLSEIPALLS
ncbi:MAG: haloacid dehalogenase type II [Aestuariivirgaceae bacterium]|nr:haloacid dehalogenase type II [Aestuariivirgaceae bacterium]